MERESYFVSKPSSRETKSDICNDKHNVGSHIAKDVCSQSVASILRRT